MEGALPSLVLEGPSTITSREQQKTEADVLGCFQAFLRGAASEGPQSVQAIKLNRELHVGWLNRGLGSLPTNFSGLDASRPWFVYWISHALEVLGAYDESVWAPKVASFLAHCQDAAGGFGGGPGQLPHLAPTYAAVAALLVAGSDEAYRVVNRQQTYRFLMQMKCPDGGFKMHDEGERDMRGTYCAIAVASMLHIVTDELVEGVPEYIKRCQTWEGGIAGEEGLEAHGGYSYCGLASLCILGKAGMLDLEAFLRWASCRQLRSEGGFQGRTNKLVDSCYSFWQGAIFPLLHEAFRQDGIDMPLPATHSWFAPEPLQAYVFLACQHPGGGMRDKPGKAADFYHSCYALSGVAATQYQDNGATMVVGDSSNLLERIDVYYNVNIEKAERKCKYFASQPPFTYDGRQVQGCEGAGAIASRRRILAQPPRVE